MRRIRRDIEFVYFVDFDGSTSFRGPYATKQPTGSKGKLRKYRLVEVPLDEPKTVLTNANVLYKKTIQGVNVLITNGKKVEDKLIYDAQIWVECMSLKKNHSGFDDKDMEKEFCCQLIDVKTKYGKSD